MRDLPGLMMSNSTRNSTAQTALTELDARLERIRKVLASGQFPDNTGSEGDTRMNCTFSMYGQLRPLPPGTTRNDVQEFEDELHTPTGRSVAPLPRSQMDAIVYSRDCNLLFELGGMEGLEIDRFWSKATSYAAVLSVLTLLQTWVLVKQMEYTSTPTVRHNDAPAVCPIDKLSRLAFSGSAVAHQSRAPDHRDAGLYGCLLLRESALVPVRRDWQ